MTRVNDSKAAKPVREGSPLKRAAIVAAARELFVQQGVDRVSMDAVASSAKVSKATVYEYFGDKRRLFLAILADVSQSLLATVQLTLDKHLSDTAPITTVPQLQQTLTEVAIDLGQSVVGSADYSDGFALVAQERRRTPSTEGDIATDAVVLALAERLGHFVDVGLVETDRPELAAEHFFALTVLLAFDRHPGPANRDAQGIRQTMIDGVHAFVRAYSPR
jgi:TetR/AcrR family transcriptional repressor of mexJK operon